MCLNVFFRFDAAKLKRKTIGWLKLPNKITFFLHLIDINQGKSGKNAEKFALLLTSLYLCPDIT
jgi:hypothetical protein